MESNTAVVQPTLTREESGTLLGQTMALVAATAGVFALGAYLGRDLSYGWGLVLVIAATTSFYPLLIKAAFDAFADPMLAESTGFVRRMERLVSNGTSSPKLCQRPSEIAGSLSPLLPHRRYCMEL